ncbi:uncharacterized protein LOC143287446 [Babylonia areolata]|uniref:uncharacterized protein LOC143287446 n=1 Tax=Babylonia areolata TaxID=304850 RepID=UPI003FD375AA
MLTAGLQLSGTQVQYVSALNAPGNLRSGTSTAMPRTQSQGGPVAAINVLAADCKVMQLHEKRSAGEVRPKPFLNPASSVFSVYAPRHLPATRVSADNSSVKVKKRSNSPHKPVLQKRTHKSPVRSVESTPLRRSLPGSSEGVSSAGDRKATKVYLSQKQSSSVKDCGVLVPCAPPATPTPEHLKMYDYVPSLSDIKSQRHMRHRLEGMSKSEQKKLEKKREEQLRQEKQSYKERLAEQKKRQRQEIYALNKVMTDLEYQNFEQMVKTKGLNIST